MCDHSDNEFASDIHEEANLPQEEVQEEVQEEPQASNASSSTCGFAEGDEVVRHLHGDVRSGYIQSVDESSVIIVWREESDTSPICERDERLTEHDCIRSHEIDACILSNTYLLDKSQRYSAFGAPGLLFQSARYFRKIIHRDFGTYSYGTKVLTPAGGKFWCLGATHDNAYRSPLSLILYDTTEDSVSCIRMTKECSKMVTVSPETGDEETYQRALATFREACHENLVAPEPHRKKIAVKKPSSTQPMAGRSRKTSRTRENLRSTGESSRVGDRGSRRCTSRARVQTNVRSAARKKPTVIHLDSDGGDSDGAKVDAYLEMRTKADLETRLAPNVDLKPPSQPQGHSPPQVVSIPNRAEVQDVITTSSSQHQAGKSRLDRFDDISAILTFDLLQDRQASERLELRMELRLEAAHRRERELERRLHLARLGFLV